MFRVLCFVFRFSRAIFPKSFENVAARGGHGICCKIRLKFGSDSRAAGARNIFSARAKERARGKKKKTEKYKIQNTKHLKRFLKCFVFCILYSEIRDFQPLKLFVCLNKEKKTDFYAEKNVPK